MTGKAISIFTKPFIFQRKSTFGAICFHGTIVPLIFLILLSGCASQVSNPWDSIDVPRGEITQPIELGKFPLPSQTRDESILYDLQGVNELEAYRLTAEANTAIATAHAEQIEALRKGIEGLVEAGKAQRRIADMRQEILEEERRHWMFEKVGYWFAIIGLGLAL